MALVINSNISSLNSQRQLVKSGMEMDQAMERLSSGKRINSAADDAAGLVISNRLTSQIKGLDRAVANAADGVSLIQTAEGALEESTNILQRMRELSIQSSNGIYNDSDRATLDAEVQQLVAELDRIADTTSFNGQNILDGTLGETKLQVGSEANQTISFSITAVDADTLGLGSTSSDLSGSNIDAALAFDQGDILINGTALDAYDETTDNLDDLLEDINSIEGVSASAYNVFEASGAADGLLDSGDTFDIVVGSTDGSASTTYSIGGTGTTTTNVDELVDLINSKTGGAVTASINEDNGRLVLSNDTGGTITVNNFSGTTAANIGFTSGDTQTGALAISSDNGEPITVTKGVNGTDTDLANLGFNEISGAGEVQSSTLNSAAQGTALTANDLIINGVSISALDADNLANKVANINAVSDETGVTASIVAEESFTFDGDVQTAQITGTQTSSTLVTAGDLTVNGVDITLTAGDSWAEVAADINAQTANTGVTAYVDSDGELNLFSEGSITLEGDGTTSFAVDSGIAAAPTTVAAAAVSTGDININNVNVSLTNLTDIDQVVTDINTQQGSTGVQASVDENGELQLKSTSAITLSIGDANGLEAAAALGITFDTNAESTDDNANDTLSIDPRIELDSADDTPISIEVTANGATATGLKDLNTDLSSTVTGTALSSISIATQSGAQKAIDSIDNALEQINSTRADLGAVNNRLEFTMSNLSNVSEKTSASRSRIMDADFAAETAALSRAQVLQQASQAMLAQANAAPQQVLSLLR